MAKAKAAAAPPSLEPLAVGIDIGGTGTKFGIVDRNGNVLFSSEISTKKHKQIESFIDDPAQFAQVVAVLRRPIN